MWDGSSFRDFVVGGWGDVDDDGETPTQPLSASRFSQISCERHDGLLLGQARSRTHQV